MEVASGGDQSASSLEYLHVLAVDDSFVDRKVIERLLRNSACRVTTVESGLRALQILGLEGERAAAEFKDLKVNLIMTDYSMPGITGYELLKKIKESSEFREIPVVIMSSENILPRIEKCLEEGAKEFILKPVKLSDVKRLKDILMKEEVKECENRDDETNKCKLEGGTTTTGISPPSSSTRDVSSITPQNKSDSGPQR